MLFNPEGHIVHIQANLLLKEFEKSLEQSFQEDYSQVSYEKTFEEYLSQCKISSKDQIKPKPNAPQTQSQNGVRLECITPKAQDSLVTITPFKPNVKNSPKSVCEDAEEFPASQSLAKPVLPRLISDDAEVPISIVSPDMASLSTRSSYSSYEDTQSTVSEAISVFPSADSYDSPCELSARSLQSLFSDLSKAVHRLNDDLFVINFNALNVDRLTPKNSDDETKSITHFSSHILDCLVSVVPDTSDPDPIVSSPLVDSRYNLLEISQFRHFQFDSLRRAKHSSLMLLYYLHNPTDDSYRPKCSNCKSLIQDLRWHCEQCLNFELCRGCKDSLSKQNGEAKTPKRAKIVEWRGDECEVEHGGFHPHPLIPFRVAFR